LWQLSCGSALREVPPVAVRVLIAHTSGTTRDIIRNHLEYGGCEVVAETETVAQTIDVVRTTRPDVVALDAGLCSAQELGALWLFRTIRRESPAAAIVIVGAPQSPEEQQTYLSEGALECIVEPLDRFGLERMWRRLSDVYPELKRIDQRTNIGASPDRQTDAEIPSEAFSPFRSGLPRDFATGMFSLMELLQFYAAAFSRTSEMLGKSWLPINRGDDSHSVVSASEAPLNELQRDCEKLGLSITSAHLKRMLQDFDPSGHISPTGFARQLSEVRQRLIDELSARSMVAVPQHHVVYYQGIDLFGEDVSRAFPSATMDIMEAGKCLALNRNTACFFHLMRVIKTGLRTLGKSLNEPNLDPKRNPTWETILSRCDDMLIRSLATRTPESREDKQFFSKATAYLRAVKDAWHNPTLHVDLNYTAEMALDGWNAVQAFMRHLATKLTETEA
jgi:CheY-like chemotaxis protein